jgi:hypothetical protein
VRDAPFEWALFLTMRGQIKTFAETKESFLRLITNLTGTDPSAFVDPHWKALNRRFLEVIKDDLPFNFLRHPIIGYTMFVKKGGRTMDTELSFLRNTFPKDTLTKVLREDYVGIPSVIEHTFQTSHNSIRLLYHLARWQQTTGLSIADIETVVEWGGGYGRMAVLFDRLHNGRPFTYVIIDTPLFSCIQWRYLSTILGQHRINFLDNHDAKIVPGKINIVPLTFVDNCDVKADLFLSTWALSECAPAALEYVIKKNLYSAKRILIGFQDKSTVLPDSERVKEIVDIFGGTVQDIPFLPKDHYIFS